MTTKTQTREGSERAISRGVNANRKTVYSRYAKGANMTANELRTSVRSKLEAAIRAQRESWDSALEITNLTGYSGDIHAFVTETAGALEDAEAIPDELVDLHLSATSNSELGVDPGSCVLVQ